MLTRRTMKKILGFSLTHSHVPLTNTNAERRLFTPLNNFKTSQRRFSQTLNDVTKKLSITRETFASSLKYHLLITMKNNPILFKRLVEFREVIAENIATAVSAKMEYSKNEEEMDEEIKDAVQLYLATGGIMPNDNLLEKEATAILVNLAKKSLNDLHKPAQSNAFTDIGIADLVTHIKTI